MNPKNRSPRSTRRWLLLAAVLLVGLWAGLSVLGTRLLHEHLGPHARFESLHPGWHGGPELVLEGVRSPVFPGSAPAAIHLSSAGWRAVLDRIEITLWPGGPQVMLRQVELSGEAAAPAFTAQAELPGASVALSGVLGPRMHLATTVFDAAGLSRLLGAPGLISGPVMLAIEGRAEAAEWTLSGSGAVLHLAGTALPLSGIWSHNGLLQVRAEGVALDAHLSEGALQGTCSLQPSALGWPGERWSGDISYDRATAQALWRPHPEAEARLDLHDPQAPVLELSASAEALSALLPPLSAWKPKGSLHGHIAWGPSGPAGRVEIVSGSIVSPLGAVRQIAGTGELRGSTLHFNSLHLLFAGMEMLVEAQLDLSSGALELRRQGGVLHLSSAGTRIEKWPWQTPAGTVYTSGALTPDEPVPTLSFSSPRLALPGGVTATDLSGELRLEGARLVLSLPQANLGGGWFWGELWTPRDRLDSWTGELRLAGVELEKIGSRAIHGRLYGRMLIAGAGSPEPSVDFEFEAQGGELRGWPALSTVLAVLNVDPQAFSEDRVVWPFSRLRVFGLWRPSRLAITDAHLQSRLGEAWGHGILAADGDLSGVLRLQPLTRLDAALRRLPVAAWLLGGDQAAVVEVVLRLAGSADSPLFIPDPASTALAPLKRLLSQLGSLAPSFDPPNN